MLQYTKGTLKSALEEWNVNSDPEFESRLDEIIRRGEIICYRTLDLDNLDSVNDTTTQPTEPQVWKPLNMIDERVVVISIDGVTRQLRKRSRAWVELCNQDQTQGDPVYYAEWDEQRWFLAPIPDTAWLITVHGEYLPESIADGDDNSTTWLSTYVPDILYYACAIEACEFLKFWAKKAQNQADFAMRAHDFTATARNLQRADNEDLSGNRMNANQPGTQEKQG